MLSERFWVFKNYFIYKEKCSFWNFIFGLFILILALYCYSGDKKQNTDFFQNTYFKQHKNLVVEKNLRETMNFYEKHCLPVIIWNERTFIVAS